MTPEERQLVNDLCKRIAEEQDAFIFHQLVEILDGLLALKKNRLNDRSAFKLPEVHHRDPLEMLSKEKNGNLNFKVGEYHLAKRGARTPSRQGYVVGTQGSGKKS
jgi:hypothetical protein